MNVSATHRTGTFVPVLLTMALVLFSGPFLFSQTQQINPRSDYQYKKDYTEVETVIKVEPDPAKRAQMMLAFVKAHPVSRMLPYLSGYYGQILTPYAQSGNWKKVIEMCEAFLAPIPTTDKTVQTEVLPTLQVLMSAYYQDKQFVKAADIGERINELKPDKNMNIALADIYLRIPNKDKYMVYAEKILADVPIEQSFGTALQMAQINLEKQNVPKALELYSKVMSVYGDKVPPGVQEPAWNVTRAVAFGLMAANVYGQKDYAKAEELYGKVAHFDAKRDDAYYFIGMCKWNSKDPEGAIESFARASVLGKTYAKRAQDYLEQLWKARHNDTLDGLDQVIAKAKSQLGVS